MMFAYMWLKDENGEPVPGSVKEAGKEGSCEILGMDYDIGISANHDVQPPVLTRRRGPVRIEKPLDSASPLLQKAICTGQLLQEVNIMVYPNQKAQQENRRFSLALSGVQIVSISVNMDHCCEADTSPYSITETLDMRYEALIWKDDQGQVIYHDPGEAA
ncbi:type VI secretion system tube protein Hcp [Nissabacter archeti]|uniref:Type VI secretion system tube protein Hcp n=1 Tax=Nissabacter archeti TaxID=1917880 RepID=A0ABS5JF38_9GAMM|nr:MULTISPECIES: type VI secretion system tube protein TssD [Yersiniaceae]MBS0967988.1 type VI secretion system tube protein Hcp [Nissabacter archeti]PLR37219.1 hypothetical protein CYR23_06255 [Chimaeribacter arupi]